jgi:hypothetical protein
LIHDQLGYPTYFVPYIGFVKLLGCIALLIPGLNKIKEWAYAGLFFDLISSIYSGIAAFGFDPRMLECWRGLYRVSCLIIIGIKRKVQSLKF